MSENPYLSGNYAPVEGELTVTDLPVTGQIPEALEGRLLRIGPNPVAPDPATYHWFAGNGMAHGVRLRGGEAHWYRRRFVRDDQVVAKMGWPDVEGPKPLFEIGDGVANTNIIDHAGRTYAIVEAGNLPVELSDELETIGRSNFEGTLPGGLSAHPKPDPDTGELHVAAYSPFWEHIQYVVVGCDGRVRKTVDVPVAGSPMVHDCSITENYFILLDLPVIFDMEMVVSGKGFPYHWSEEYGARVGLLPRNGEAADVVWCEVDPCYVFHPVNSYEDENGKVILDVIRHPKMFATDSHGPNEGVPLLYRWTLDPKGGRTLEQQVDERGQEFPRLDERRLGKPYRWGYSVAVASGAASDGGLLKTDFSDGKVQIHQEGQARAFMEPVFVPASKDAAEDEGWIMAYVYDRSTDLSDVVILDAQDFSADPLATIHLPARVPFGFHGNWIADPA